MLIRVSTRLLTTIVEATDYLTDFLVVGGGDLHSDGNNQYILTHSNVFTCPTAIWIEGSVTIHNTKRHATDSLRPFREYSHRYPLPNLSR